MEDGEGGGEEVEGCEEVAGGGEEEVEAADGSFRVGVLVVEDYEEEEACV